MIALTPDPPILFRLTILMEIVDPHIPGRQPRRGGCPNERGGVDLGRGVRDSARSMLFVSDIGGHRIAINQPTRPKRLHTSKADRLLR